MMQDEPSDVVYVRFLSRRKTKFTVTSFGAAGNAYCWRRSGTELQLVAVACFIAMLSFALYVAQLPGTGLGHPVVRIFLIPAAVSFIWFCVLVSKISQLYYGPDGQIVFSKKIVGIKSCETRLAMPVVVCREVHLMDQAIVRIYRPRWAVFVEDKMTAIRFTIGIERQQEQALALARRTADLLQLQSLSGGLLVSDG